MTARRRNVTASGLRHVYVGSAGLAGDPLCAVARLENTHGTKDLEGRETVVRLTLPELARVLGALPPVALGWQPEDTRALIHVLHKLDPHVDAPRALRVSHHGEPIGEGEES